MVWALPLKILEPFPRLIQRLVISLSDGSDFGSQLSGLARWEVLAQEGFSKVFPCDDGVRIFIEEPITGSIFQGKWGEP